jgi:hypothetical protein
MIALYRMMVVALVLMFAPPVRAQTMGELNAAQGIHGTLARQGVSGQVNTVKRVQKSLDESNDRHNSWQDDVDKDEREDSRGRREHSR